MKTVSGYIAVFAVLALAACGDAVPEERGAAIQSASPAVQEDSTDSIPSADAGIVEPVEATEPTPAPSAGAEELAAGGDPSPSTGSTAPAEPAARERSAASEPEPSRAVESPSEVNAVLRRAELAYDEIRSLEADFVQAVTVPLLETTQHSQGKLFIRRPDRFLMRFSQPEGDIVVSDGSYFWMYYPSADPKQVMRTSVGDGSRQVDLQQEFLSNPTERYDAVLQGVESVDGRPAHVVQLIPKGPSGYQRVRIWVDREDALVRRFEIVEENESVRRLDLRGLRPNVALSDQLFRFTPPPGTQVFTQ